MKPRFRSLPLFGVLLLPSLLLLSCGGGLSPSLQRDITAEHSRLQAARHQLDSARETVHDVVSKAPDLFAASSAAAAWEARFRSAREKLDRAENDDRQLENLSRHNRDKSQLVPKRLLAEERSLRESVQQEANHLTANARHWLDFRRDLPGSLGHMDAEYRAIEAFDLAPASQVADHAAVDWPAKKGALETRLATLREIRPASESEWQALEPARRKAAGGQADGTQIAALIEADQRLAQRHESLISGSAEVRSLSGQLYDSWDQILTDLDAGRYGEDSFYRERLKTVRTHFVDVAAKKTETHSDEHWANVSEADFRSVENDLGMAISHKDAGLFDSEASTKPQPAGFAYMAPPAQGSNQYGYWSHSGGESVWTFLPQYLILRELLWNRDYRPVPVGEYNAYRTAQRSGTTYYGRETPLSTPRYGSHGTFTQTHYASSRYVQSGGFKGSPYASHGDSSPVARFGSSHSAPGSSFQNGSSSGQRFGRQPGAPSPQRFGRSGGFRPGRSFGRRR
jgi:hypothetical protein